MATTRPSIDHSLLSPSGKMSTRARKAAMKREREKLFPAGFWDRPEPTAEEATREQIRQKLQQAKELRELADRGMSPRKFRRAAEKLENDAEKLEAEAERA